MEMKMNEYYGGGGSDGDWLQYPLAAFPAPLPLCSPAPSPLLVSEHSCSLPIAAALAADDDRGALGNRSPAFTLREEDMAGYLPMIPAPAAGDDLYSYPLNVLPPLPADLDTAGLDDALLMQPLSFSDIDLEAFGADIVVVDEQKSVPLDTSVSAPVDHHNLGAQPQAQHPRPTKILSHQPSAARGVRVHGHRDGSIAVVTGYETAAVGYAEEHRQQQRQVRQAARRARRSGADGSAAASGGARSLDHIGFEELRRYFYMPITRAAREMNVGLTVLKKRCRELGVARWPHRKMKSLRSLILNIQEMGKGMSSAAVQGELEALERYCARMEENPAIELTEQTKKLRQACFKENYKRRRAAAVNMLDHCYDFGHDQQLPLPQMISRHTQQSTSFFGY